MTPRHPRPHLILLLLLAVLPAARAHAAGAHSIDLFRGLDAISLSTSVGGPLDLGGGEERRLFADDLRRFNYFELDLKTALAGKLESCGIMMDPGARDILSVELYGRFEELRECRPHFVYLIQVKVLNSELEPRKAEIEPVSLPPVIGVADGADLERALIEAAVATITRELRSCRR
jgi:hypothetical protein